MILPLTVFAQLAATCAPHVALETLTGIARTESSLDPYAFLDNTTSRSYRPQDQAEAIRMVAPLLAAGHSIDAGLMGINVANWGWLELSAESVFDPCQNIRAGAAVLTAFSRYNTGSPTKGFRNGYVQRVVANVRPPSAAPAPAKQPTLPPKPPQQTSPIAKPAAPSWNAFQSPAPAQAPNAWNAFTSRRGE